jgi:prolipoprotein diacylglyceryl transferase
MQLLSVYWDVDPVFIRIGDFKMGYYNLIFLSGFIIGYFIGQGFFKREGKPVSILWDLLFTLLVSTIIGARLGHCFFYDAAHYWAHPLEILQLWRGGLASHGGTIGCLIGVWFYVRKYGKKYGFNYIWLVDRIVIPTGLAACFIRLGNLMNSEIYGVETSLPWGFIFARNGETIAKHPTQLYEALCYFLTFALLMFLYKKYLPKLKDGFITGLFFVCIFTSRFFIEFVKETQVAFENDMSLDMGQWLSIPFVLAGIGLMVYSFKWGKPSLQTPQPTYYQAPTGKKKK